MKVPFSWLSEFIDLQDLDPYKVAEELTLKSVETSVNKWDIDLDGVVYAKIVEKKNHPTRDLAVYKVKAGEGLYLQVVSADKDLEEGKGVLLALPNSRVGRVYDVWITFGSVHEVRAFRERKKRSYGFKLSLL